MSHDHAPDISVLFTQEFWDERHRSADMIWSGDANPHLVATATDLVPAAAEAGAAGTFLIVGHHPSDLETSMGRPRLLDLMSTADQIAAVLDPDDWQIIVAAAPERQAVDPDGRSITIRDAVLRAVRH